MKIKKFAQSDRYGNSLSIEFEVPPMENQVPQLSDYFSHPGGPVGTDTVPAWLTPGERVMNAEAERMYGPQLEAMNEQGRAIQRAQGGTIPEYAACGGKVKYKAQGGPIYAQEGDLIPYPIVPTEPGMLSTEIPTPYDDYTINARRLLLDQEGYKTKPYQDSLGNWTVGAGHKIVDKDTLSKLNAGESINYQPDQLMGFFEKDYETAASGAKQNFKDFDSYPAELQHALISMNYQLGTEGTSKFEKMREALSEKDWDRAVKEAGNSKWAKQTPVRAAYLQSQISRMKDSPLVNEMDIPMSASNAPIMGANGDQYNIDTLTASTAPPVPQAVNTPVNPNVVNQSTQEARARLQEQIEIFEANPDLDILQQTQLEQMRIQKERLDNMVQPDPIVSASSPVDEFSNISRDLQSQVQTDVVPEISNGETKIPAEVPEIPKVPEPDKPVNEVKTPTTQEEFDQLVTWNDIKDDPDWQVISAGKNVEPSFLSQAFDYIKNAVMDSGLIDTKQLTRAAMLYAGSRALGYNHEGSGQYAIKNYLTGIAAKDKHISKLIESGKADPDSIAKYRRSGDPADIKPKTTVDLGSDIKVGLVRNQNGDLIEVPVQYNKNANRWGYLGNDGAFTPVSAGTVRDRVQPRTPQEISESWQKLQNEWEKNVGQSYSNLLDSKTRESLANKNIRILDNGTIARQAESAFRDMGYDPDDPRTVREMPTIIDQALVAYTRELKSKKYADLSFEPYIRQEIAVGKLGGNKEAAELLVMNPEETDLSKREYSDTRQVLLTLDSMDLIAQESLSSLDKYKDKEIPKEAVESKRNSWVRQAARHFNSPQGKALREKYTGNEDLGQSGFMEYLIQIMTDDKITPEEIGLKK